MDCELTGEIGLSLVCFYTQYLASVQFSATLSIFHVMHFKHRKSNFICSKYSTTEDANLRVVNGTVVFQEWAIETVVLNCG